MSTLTVILAVTALGLAPFSIAGSQGTVPPRRAHHALVYDETRGAVLLSGGSTPLDSGRRFEMFNDVWTFDGTRWTALPPSGDRMSGTSLVFDSRRGRVVSLGGYDGRSRGDLREFSSGAWRGLGRHPGGPVAEPGFVYDRRRDVFVAFGGSAGPGQALGETWELSDTTWTRVAAAGPSARQGYVMVYDERRGVTVLFGGAGTVPRGQRPPMLNDVWEYDGRQWRQRPETGPSARASAGAAYDARRSLVIVFGGATPEGFRNDTWAWDGTAWRELSATGPEPRAMGYLAYDRRRDRVVLFGGRKGWPDGDLNDTWEWDGSSWRLISAGGP